MEYNLIATTTFGLEGITAKELRALGYDDVKTETSKVYHGLGSVLSVLESRFGFLFLIIFPILILFIYEVFIVIKEVKTPDEE